MAAVPDSGRAAGASACQLTLAGIEVRFPVSGGRSLPALGPVDLRIDAGEFVSLVGPSGCGKSTLVRVIAGLQAPTAGRVRHDGHLVQGPSPRIGLMFQQANLMPWRSVRDNVALPLELAGVSKAERYATADDLLRTLGLTGFADTYPGALSGGMAQRVALGRALAQSPDVLLLDEPFGALDALTREQISFELLRARAHKTVVMVTHDIQEAVLLADRVVVLSRRPGLVIADLPVPLDRPRHPEQVYTPAFIDTARRVREAINRA